MRDARCAMRDCTDGHEKNSLQKVKVEKGKQLAAGEHIKTGA
jgi:hypothetical protein